LRPIHHTPGRGGAAGRPRPSVQRCIRERYRSLRQRGAGFRPACPPDRAGAREHSITRCVTPQPLAASRLLANDTTPLRTAGRPPVRHGVKGSLGNFDGVRPGLGLYFYRRATETRGGHIGVVETEEYPTCVRSTFLPHEWGIRADAVRFLDREASFGAFNHDPAHGTGIEQSEPSIARRGVVGAASNARKICKRNIQG
jgi:hypothetical protein